MPVILGALAGAVFAFSSAASYKSTASLWVDTAPPLASSVGAGPSVPLITPPAASEQGILNELLTTQAFAVSVAKNSSLGKVLGSSDSISVNAPAELEGGQVTSTVAGSQLLKISYSGPSPGVAQSVVKAIISQLREYNSGLTGQHNQQSVSYEAEQVKLDQAAVASARSNVNAYLSQHPGATQADPSLAALTAAENTAVAQLGQANSTLSQAAGTHNVGGWSMEVVDSASHGIATSQGKKQMVVVILGGAFGGLVLSFLVIVALTPAKREAWEDELPLGTPHVANGAADPSPGQRSVPWAVGNEHAPVPNAVREDGSQLPTLERRFTFVRLAKYIDE